MKEKHYLTLSAAINSDDRFLCEPPQKSLDELFSDFYDILAGRRSSSFKRRQRAAENNRRRHKTDANYRLRCVLRCRLRDALHSQSAAKQESARILVGCSLDELRQHLEKQFREGMAWENHGRVWHIDHKKPCNSFDLTKLSEQRDCFHFSNLQPLFVRENLSKGCRT